MGQATDAVQKAMVELGAPPTLNSSFQGTAQAFQSSVQGLGLLLIVAIAVIYLVLGILYESFVHPLTIMTSLPLSLPAGPLERLL